jgi:ABC-type nitrate/sulfonate/bicarbonate transport system ATPase subunit
VIQPIIRIEELEVHRNGTRICHVPELEVRDRERIGVVGPNGSGKSTLLMVLAGLDQTARGRCAVAVPVRDRVYVHQQPFLFKGTVLANATYGLRAHGVAAKSAAKIASQWLERLAVVQLSERACDNLSGGEKRRVALARALALRPRLLLLDEPLADLDDSGTALVVDALAELRASTLLIAGPTDFAGALVSRTHVMLGSEG